MQSFIVLDYKSYSLIINNKNNNNINNNKKKKYGTI